MYRRWILEQYDNHADIVIRDGSGSKGDAERTLPDIANAFVQHFGGTEGKRSRSLPAVDRGDGPHCA
jgi:hypothetical protein